MTRQLDFPQLVSVFEYPATTGKCTIGQLLEWLYAEFAIDLARRKLDGTLAAWTEARLRSQPLDPSLDPGGAFRDDFLDITPWLKNSVGCPPARQRNWPRTRPCKKPGTCFIVMAIPFSGPIRWSQFHFTMGLMYAPKVSS